MGRIFFHKMSDSYFCTYMNYNLSTFVSSPRKKNDNSQRHDDVISMHSR